MKKSIRFTRASLIMLTALICLAIGRIGYCDETAELERKQALEDAEIQKIQEVLEVQKTERTQETQNIQRNLSRRESMENLEEKLEKINQRKNVDNVKKSLSAIDKLKADAARQLTASNEKLAKLNEELNERLGNRLVISEITPETKNGVVCSFNIETTQEGDWRRETLYPKDAIPVKLRMDGPMDGAIVTGKGSHLAQAGDISLLNANSILRFSGKVTLKGVVFEGEKDDPLAFILLDNGFVYVTGKGKVTLSEGKSVVLPN